MAFWNGELLLHRLPELIEPFDPNKVDCAAYTLTLGDEVFVTSEETVDGNPKSGLKSKLEKGDSIKIPPGQFAFLLTHETIQVPSDAISFISIKAGFKFRGLINVSGFHVDPGWNGRIVFSVYNAGPAPVQLEYGMELFLIWYANLVNDSTHIYEGNHKSRKSIELDLINNMGGLVFSPTALANEVKALKQKNSTLSEKIIELKSDYQFTKKIFWLFFSATVIYVFRSYLTNLFSSIIVN